MLCKYLLATVLLPALLVPIPARADDPVPPATITVDAAKPVGTVNERVFGDNIEAADSKHVFGDTTNLAPLHSGTGFWDEKKLCPVPAVVSQLRTANVTMLRYPGGSLANCYNWHRAVGPLWSRGDWHFGIDEYIATCRAIGCEPQFIVSDYTGTPKDAAELVQYLNSPAAPGRPWAQLRAKDGHPQPYNVKWFELGNESDNGGGFPRRQYTPAQYAAYARATAAAMRAVDPSVKIGIIAATVRPPDDPWNPAVLRLAGATADFFVVHWYAVGYDASVPQGTLMQACMAAGDQFDIMLGQYHALIRKCVGHDLPIALTEYNCGFVQEKPEPYRYSLGAALFSADLIRVLLKPQNKILFANYWQAVNGYWGMIHGSGDKWTYMPEYPLRRLWGQHFGRTLLATTVYSPTEAFAGAGNTRPASGATYRPRSPLPGNQFSVSQVSPGSSGPVSWTASNGGVLTFDLPAVSGNRYVSFGLFNAPRQTAGVGGRYDCSCDIRAVASAGDAQYSLGTGDARGWDQTHSAVKTPGITADGQWHHVEAIYRTLPDTRSLAVLLRVENSTSPVTAQVAIKNLVITAETAEALPAYPLVTASSSRSANGKTIYVVVFNKSTDKDIACTVNVAHANAISARRWTVTGPSLASTNVDGPAVAETETAISTPMAHSQLTRSFPAHSMTAFEISVR